MPPSAVLPWDNLAGRAIHLVGIKGNGVAALAALLHAEGARLTGSDTGETFFTDALLSRLGIPVSEDFGPEHLNADVAAVIHSPAYDRQENPQLAAASHRGLPVLSYPEALGELSRQVPSAAVSGSAGKTSTTALAAVLARALGLPATVLVPSLVPDLDGLPVHRGGRDLFIAETCEYRRHFLSFHPRWIVMTNIEAEHLDYYRDWDDVCSAFEAFARRLPAGGELIHNADDAGCGRVARSMAGSGVRLVGVGRAAEGAYRMVSLSSGAGLVEFRLAGSDDVFQLTVPGIHNAHNAAQALALVCAVSGVPYPQQPAAARERMRDALRSYRGCKRRCERVGEARGVTVLDDYGHNPTKIRSTLESLRTFYPGRRLVLDFMPHLYSRTRALFREFTTCFDAADEVLLHRVYPSARERDDGSNLGRTLADEVSKRRGRVRYVETFDEAAAYLTRNLRSGDVLVTMGAGDNWRVGSAVLEGLGGGR